MKIEIERIRKLKLDKNDIVFIEYDPKKISIPDLNHLYKMFDTFIGRGNWLLHEKGMFTKIKCIKKEEK